MVIFVLLAMVLILYADDILLLSPSVIHLERLLHHCEEELAWLDVNINFQNSCCLRVGPRYDVQSAVLMTDLYHGHRDAIPWRVFYKLKDLKNAH